MAGKRQRSKGLGTVFKRHGRGPWIARWYDQNGKRHEQSTRTTDKAAAERILSKRVADVALRRDGVIDARDDKYSAAETRVLSAHIGDWKAALVAAGLTTKQVNRLLAHVNALVDMIQVERLSDLSASTIQRAIGELHDKGRSLQTCQHYLRAIKQFSRWLKRDGRIRDDTLAHLTGYHASTDRRHERRPLTADELCVLIESTETAPTWRKLTGHDRAMLYSTAAGTGFRASELRSLTPTSLHLDADRPAIALQATHSKRRREDLQPIRPDLAEGLRAWLGDKLPDAPLWPGRWNEKAARMIRADLRRARARWIRATRNRQDRRARRESEFLVVVDGGGRVVDFHALRVTYVTLLVKGGATMKQAQDLARHSDPKLDDEHLLQAGSP